MKEKPKLKPGDKIGWDAADTGEPIWQTFIGWEKDKARHGIGEYESVHWRFIKRIRREKPARVWWVNEGRLRSKGIVIGFSWKAWFESDGIYIRNTPPENPEGWIMVKEVKKWLR